MQEFLKLVIGMPSGLVIKEATSLAFANESNKC
jgi:hypothetical protein